MRDKNDCLAASLTLLYYTGTIHHTEIKEAISTGGYEGLFDLLNDKFREMTSGDHLDVW
ncbi:hypothetical protein J26TS2_00460 [Shouchella clausii]|nr:hypothetical protein J26TS2_00460 [Shouchella clausii]